MTHLEKLIEDDQLRATMGAEASTAGARGVHPASEHRADPRSVSIGDVVSHCGSEAFGGAVARLDASRVL